MDLLSLSSTAQQSLFSHPNGQPGTSRLPLIVGTRIACTLNIRRGLGHLARRLIQSTGHSGFAVANENIGGNAILHNIIGPHGLARFDRDVLALPNVTYVVLLEGINDIGFTSLPGNPASGSPVSSNEMIGAYRNLADSSVSGISQSRASDKRNRLSEAVSTERPHRIERTDWR
jgi:hypothetical protein